VSAPPVPAQDSWDDKEPPEGDDWSSPTDLRDGLSVEVEDEKPAAKKAAAAKK
jgi:hypothetical protein